MGDSFPLWGFPLLAILAILAVLWFRRAALRDPRNARGRVEALALELGLDVARGDPNYNLILAQPHSDRLTQVLLRGSDEGTPLELSYRREVNRVTSSFACRMSARGATRFPEFEVISRNITQEPILQLPPAATGNAAVDAKYAVMTREAALARALGEQLAAFDALLTSGGVHLVADGRDVAFVMRDASPPFVSLSLLEARSMATGLVTLARALGG
jgi:hypothetical protein